MKRVFSLIALSLFLCSTASAFQGGGGESTKTRKPTPKPTVTRPTTTVPKPTTSRAASNSRPQNPQIELVRIPPGTFMMGGNDGINEQNPTHQVTINYSFYMGKYEVTQAQWQTAMGNNPSNFKDCGSNCPVENVSWDDAQNFINKLNGLGDRFKYRLPTESEWEYACRAVTTGDENGSLDQIAWHLKNSGNRTHAVGQKQPNAWGLFDMHGNVMEWCQDWYHENYNGAPSDGSAWLEGGEQKYRVLRGMSWAGYIGFSGLHGRTRTTPGNRESNVGLRVVAVARTQ